MRPNGQPETSLQHFSHPHPLTLSNHQHLQTLNLQIASCACCKLNASGWIYSCTPCSYFLHISCSQMPQQITHPFDHKKHVLSLLPTPKYPYGAFNCDACMNHGNGFAYHCQACNIDLHPKCASMPLLLTHDSHPHHQLSLTFSLPAGSNHTFICDICNGKGHKKWLYLCIPCCFTAHLGCATAKPRVPPIQQTQTAAQTFSGTQYFPTGTSAPLFPNYVPNTNNNGIPGVYGQTVSVGPMNNNIGSRGNVMNKVLQSLIGFGRIGGSPNQGLGNIQTQMINQILGGGGPAGGGGGFGGNDLGVGITTDFGSNAGDPSSISTDFFSGAGGGFGDFGDFSSF